MNDTAELDEPVSLTVLDGAELNAIVDALVQCGTPFGRGLEERLEFRRKVGLDEFCTYWPWGVAKPDLLQICCNHRSALLQFCCNSSASYTQMLEK